MLQNIECFLTEKQPMLLCLKGQTGTVACRVHDSLASKMFPQRSSWGRLKYAWLSEEKMHNITAVRGVPGASMVGPADYFGDLERSDQYLYTIEISHSGIPKFKEHSRPRGSDENIVQMEEIIEAQLTRVKANWISGSNTSTIRQKKVEYENKNPMLGASLFPNAGILEIDGPKKIKLPNFDPKGKDLSTFKARLVPNDIPFHINTTRLPVDEEYCAVSYQYEEGYADREVMHGGGVFLEFHQFAQTITPLHRESNGFVTLAKWDETHTHLELIAIQIPYGYTLIIKEGCIHGDVNLNGQFMMCMTSDHIAMATADTVFLKHADDKENIALVMDHTYESKIQPARMLTPLVFFKANKAESYTSFQEKILKMDIIFSPCNLGYWEVKQQLLYTGILFGLAGTCLLAGAIFLNTMFTFSMLMFSSSLVSAGIGLWWR